MTLALAIWGAVLGTASAAFQLLTFLRDRPKLALTTHYAATIGRPPEIGLDVANRGRQATTLMDVAFEVDRELTIAHEGVELASGKQKIDLSPNQVRTVLPGEVMRYRLVLKGWPADMAFVDDALRPYVVDSHGRRTWGHAERLLARLVDSGHWRPQNVRPELLQRATGPVVASAVEPRWKIWLPTELRRPTKLL